MILFCLDLATAYNGYSMGLDVRKPVFGGFVNSKGADQPARMISAFVIPIWKNIIPKLATVECNFSD